MFSFVCLFLLVAACQGKSVMSPLLYHGSFLLVETVEENSRQHSRHNQTQLGRLQRSRKPAIRRFFFFSKREEGPPDRR